MNMLLFCCFDLFEIFFIDLLGFVFVDLSICRIFLVLFLNFLSSLFFVFFKSVYFADHQSFWKFWLNLWWGTDDLIVVWMALMV